MRHRRHLQAPGTASLCGVLETALRRRQQECAEIEAALREMASVINVTRARRIEHLVEEATGIR
jgi:hypothetical protein